ncbi:MAG: HEAT repeat domain-containing protein, partial [Tannerellaceae bacterium]
AQQALLSALNTTSPALKKNIINALGESQTAEAEALLLQQVGKVAETDSRALYYALGRCGGEKSLSILANAAKQVGYTMEYSGANDAYITLIGKMAATGNTKLAEKHAKDLMKQSEKANQQGTRAAYPDKYSSFNIEAKKSTLSSVPNILN